MKPSITLVAGAGVLLILAALVMAIGDASPDGSVIGAIYTGKEVACTARVDAQIIGDPLRVTSAFCTAEDACIVSPTRGLSIFSREGGLSMRYAGEVYDSESVDVSVLSTTSKPYTLRGCVPKEADRMNIVLYNQGGGVLYDQAIAIQ